MTLAAFLLVACCLAAIANASTWTVETKTDSMTDQIRRSATVKNEQGFRLSIYRVESGAVWALFALPEAGSDVLGSRLPMLRIDKKQPQNLDDSRQVEGLAGFSFAKSEPKWVNFLLWHGKGEPNTGTLRDLMDGQVVVFRYWLFTGGYKETSFALATAKEAIATALGVSAEADPIAARAEEERKARLSAANKECDAKYPLKAGDRQTMRASLECRKVAIDALKAGN
jgi:hypothetical protein